MIKQIQAQKLLKSDELVREPVDDLSYKIINNDSKRIILCGGRGTGKSVVLYNNELKGLGNSEQTVFMSFESIIVFPNEYTEVFNEQFINHYYEIQFCSKLLNYIKRNYSLTYEMHFKFYEQLLKDIASKTNDYINNCMFGEVSLDIYIKPTQFSETILKNLKAYLGIDSINLAIDRFDWIHGSSAIVQNTLTKFFDMFDKVIITSDDEVLQNKLNRDDLINKGYSFIDVNYSENEFIIKEIIKKRIRKYNQDKKMYDLTFPEDTITNEIYHSLISRTNGNITCMFDCISGVISEWQWKDKNIDLEKTFDKQCEQQLIKVMELKRMDANPPKLHL